MTSWLEPDTGYYTFLWAHVPLFTLALFTLMRERTRALTQHIIAGFLVVHAVLHSLFSGHEHYHFHGLSSGLLIYGSAALGICYFVLVFKDKKQH